MAAADVINLVSALVWPAIVVPLVLLFRDPIKNLLGRLKSRSLARPTAQQPHVTARPAGR